MDYLSERDFQIDEQLSALEEAEDMSRASAEYASAQEQDLETSNTSAEVAVEESTPNPILETAQAVPQGVENLIDMVRPAAEMVYDQVAGRAQGAVDLIMGDASNAIAAGVNQLTPEGAPWKPFTQWMEDNILGNDERQDRMSEIIQQMRDSGDNSRFGAEALLGLDRGTQAGLLMPVTVAGAILNQNTSEFSDPPAILDDSPLGQTTFALSEILVASGLFGAPLRVAGVGVVGTAAVESAFETATTEDFDDVLFSEQTLSLLGDAGHYLGYGSKEDVVAQLRSGNSNSRVVLAITAYLQNMGINLTSEALIKAVSRGLKGADEVVSPSVREVAERTGKSADEVQQSIDDVVPARLDREFEPNELATIDTQVPVSKPNPGNTAINSDALVKETFTPTAIARSADNGTAGKSYFTNWQAITDNAKWRTALQEATATLKPLAKSAGKEAEEVVSNAAQWISRFLDDSGAMQLDEMTQAFPDLLKPLDASKPFDVLENAVTTPEGLIAAAAIGEELGIRIGKAAQQVNILDTAGQDFTKAVDNLLQLTDRSEYFLVPLRRTKRKWAVEGQVQQSRNINAMSSRAGIRKSRDEVVAPNVDASSREFTVIRKDPADPGQTLRELAVAYRNGDVDAGNTLKAYAGMIAYANPETVLAQTDNLTDVLREQMKIGNRSAATNLYYQYMLTRISPVSSSLGSNLFQLVKEPLGNILNGDVAYGAGQLVGTATAWTDALQSMRRAFQDGRGLNQGSKVDLQNGTRAGRAAEMDRLFEGRLREMNQDGAGILERANARMQYARMQVSNLPGVDVAARALLATDEGAKSLRAAQIASGRAWKEAADRGIKRGGREFSDLVKYHNEQIFQDGIKSGKIVDPDVVEHTRRITFQSDIPANGNIVDQAFKSVETAANNSAIAMFASPFTRVSYNTLEQGGIMLAGALGGNLPNSPGRWLLSQIPRYKAILNGEMGETAMLSLKGNLAFSQAWTMGVAGIAMMGGITGVNPPDGLPRNSFIIPMPGTKEGYFAISYARVEPVATITSIVADTVNLLRDDYISKGEYDKVMAELLSAVGLATLDKTFTTGLIDTAALFDARNWSQGTLRSVGSALPAVAASVLPIGAAGGLVRMVGDFSQPTQTISQQKDDPIGNMFRSFQSRAFGGAGLPPLFDPLTGQPETKLTHFGGPGNLEGASYWAAVLAAPFKETFFPGGVKGRSNDPAAANREQLSRWSTQSNGQENELLNPRRMIQTYRGVSLTPQQQSILSEEMSTVGDLNGNLTVYFNSQEHKNLVAQYDSFIKRGQPDRANAIRSSIQANISALIQGVKEQTINQGSLRNDNNLNMRLLENAADKPFRFKRSSASGNSDKQAFQEQVNDLLNMYR